MAFITGPALPTRSALSTKATWTCSASPQPLSRRTLLTTGAAAAASLLAAAAVPAPASAEKGRGLERAFSKVLFPKEGFNAPDSQVGTATTNKDLLASKEGQAALLKIRGYSNGIDDLYNSFKLDPQIELADPVRKLISISELRSALNVVNEAIDEDGQTQTDKVVRGIIQDIGELENVAYKKKGNPRTPKKIERTTDWFEKVTGDFSRLLSFYS